VTRLLNNRTCSAFAGAAMVIALVPVLVVSQTGRANEPWDNPWAEPWPELLDHPVLVDAELAALQRRIDASRERLLNSGSSIEPTEPL